MVKRCIFPNGIRRPISDGIILSLTISHWIRHSVSVHCNASYPVQQLATSYTVAPAQHSKLFILQKKTYKYVGRIFSIPSLSCRIYFLVLLPCQILSYILPAPHTINVSFSYSDQQAIRLLSFRKKRNRPKASTWKAKLFISLDTLLWLKSAFGTSAHLSLLLVASTEFALLLVTHRLPYGNMFIHHILFMPRKIKMTGHGQATCT